MTPNRDYINRSDVLHELLRREQKGCSLAETVVVVEDKALFLAAERTFGLWAYALKSAGISPCQTQKRLTHAQIIERIQILHLRGDSLSLGSIRRKQKFLYKQALLNFHNWWGALAAAGFEPERFYPPQYWSKAMVVEIIQKRHCQNLSLSKSRVCPHALRTAADWCFGSWESALRASGVPLPKIYTEKKQSILTWNSELILACIRARVVMKLPIHCRQIRLQHHPLYAAARRRFGGWSQALAAAGVSEEDLRNSRNRART